MWPLLKRDGVALQYVVLTGAWAWSVGGWSFAGADEQKEGRSREYKWISTVCLSLHGTVASRFATFFLTVELYGTRPSSLIKTDHLLAHGRPPPGRVVPASSTIKARPVRRTQRRRVLCLFLWSVGRQSGWAGQERVGHAGPGSVKQDKEKSRAFTGSRMIPPPSCDLER